MRCHPAWVELGTGINLLCVVRRSPSSQPSAAMMRYGGSMGETPVVSMLALNDLLS